ncbi:hypothetical protein AAF712_014720 [Marasmius tenuissimus]|uniref:Uncharacterized protein n=1 Tax=Marasmius tenuissimus TaxID=585030 RepID=A0ABR2ZC80_9AGAR
MVHGMPYLWSCISVVGEFAFDIIPLLKHCLRRSQPHPLSVRLSAGVWNLPRNETAHECIALVAEHAHRIKKLHVGGTYFSRVLQLLNVTLPLPALESFQTSGHYSGLGHNSLMWQGLLHAPLLRDVSLYEDPWRVVRTDNLCLPYHQLTSLALMGYGNDEDITRVVLQVLPLCTKLTSLKTPFLASIFSLRNHTTPIPQPQGVTVLPSLQRLTIAVSWAPIDIDTFFTHFDFPNLSALEIEFTGSLSPQFVQEAFSGTLAISSRPPAFQRALSSLSSLNLRCPMTFSDGWPVTPILRATPALQSFELGIPGLNAVGTPSDVLVNCLDTLIISRNKETVVPELSSLVVWDACLTICDLNAVACEGVVARLVQMARSRVDANLRHFQLEYSNYKFTPEDWPGSAKAGNHESNSTSDVCWCHCAGQEGRIPSPWRGIRGQLQPLRESGLQVEVKYRDCSF